METTRYISCILILLAMWAVGCSEAEPEGPPKSIDELFSEYFTAPEWPANQQDDHVLWQAAGAWYRDKAFGGTSNALKAAVEDSSFQRNRDEVDFYQGVCQLLLARDLVAHLQGKKPGEEAIRLFDAIPEDSPYNAKARWLKALTYMRMGWVAESREALDEVGKPYKEQAKRLKKSLLRLPDKIEQSE